MIKYRQQKHRRKLHMKKLEGYTHGIDLGGWLSQCDYSQDRLENFIKEEDIAKIKSWGLDHVRVPVDYNIFQDDKGGFIPSGFVYVDRVLDWCEKYGLNMILDLHKTRGFSFDKGENESNFFNDPALQQSFYDLWEEFSKRYVQYSDRLAFELLNEVTDKEYIDEWNRISGEAIKVIRKYSTDIKIIVGSYWNNSIDAMKDLAAPADENIVYTFHCYDPLIFTHQGAYWVDVMTPDFRISYPDTIEHYRKVTNDIGLGDLCDFDHVTAENLSQQYFEERFSEAKRVAEERNVAVYCGEYGVINLAAPQDTLNWYKDIHGAFEKFGFGRAAWSYKEMDYGLSDEHISGVIEELVKYF